MKQLTAKSFFVLGFYSLFACTQNNSASQDKEEQIPSNKSKKEIRTEPHRYGGWYCPDNLNGFPAVDIANWEQVPVVNGRMATKEETRNGASLIFVDMEKYPDAKPLDLKVPQLARYYNSSSNKEELIIIIQALNVSNDSIVGFRYLNGGNGSAQLKEVSLLSTPDIDQIPDSRFVTLTMEIDAAKNDVWQVVTNPEYTEILQAIFDEKDTLHPNWHNNSKVNFNYSYSGEPTAAFAGDLYGNQYIQIDFESEKSQYVEKFLISENQETKKAILQIVCGPYGNDFKQQSAILNNWIKEVKKLSENI